MKKSNSVQNHNYIFLLLSILFLNNQAFAQEDLYFDGGNQILRNLLINDLHCTQSGFLSLEDCVIQGQVFVSGPVTLGLFSSDVHGEVQIGKGATLVANSCYFSSPITSREAAIIEIDRSIVARPCRLVKTNQPSNLGITTQLFFLGTEFLDELVIAQSDAIRLTILECQFDTNLRLTNNRIRAIQIHGTTIEGNLLATANTQPLDMENSLVQGKFIDRPRSQPKSSQRATSAKSPVVQQRSRK